MKSSDHEEILSRIENEGFDYAFAHYSDFSEIKDKEFHNLRKNFLKARKELVDYVGFED